MQSMISPLPRSTCPRIARRAAVLLAVAGVALLAACGDSNPLPTPTEDAVPSEAGAQQQLPVRSGEPRSFAMGFLALPAALTESAYAEAFDAAARDGDFIMIQRHVPWPELAPGAALSEETRSTIETELALLQERNLDLLFAIDPWNPINRGRLAGDAPGDGFNDPAVVDAYLAYVELIVERYRPRWIALAVDIDQFAAARPDELEAFQLAYTRAYRLVKERAPETLAFPTFQLEDLQGLLPWGVPHDPQWGLFIRFRSVIDVLAVSSFPSFIFPFQADIPPEYFSRLESFGKPVAIVPSGYASEPGRNGVTFGTTSGQRVFVERLLREAQLLQWELVVWVAPRDPSFAAAAPFDLINRMGLRDLNGDPKPSQQAWSAVASRPWQPIPRDGGDSEAGNGPDTAQPDG